MRKKVIFTICLAALAQGCAKNPREKNEAFVEYRKKPSITASTIQIEQALDICKEAFPDARNPKDDGDMNFSVKKNVNLAIETSDGEFICSINNSAKIVEQIHDGKQAFEAHEFLKITREKTEQKKAKEEKLAKVAMEAKREAEQIAKGDIEGYLNKAKRKYLIYSNILILLDFVIFM